MKAPGAHIARLHSQFHQSQVYPSSNSPARRIADPDGVQSCWLSNNDTHSGPATPSPQIQIALRRNSRVSLAYVRSAILVGYIVLLVRVGIVPEGASSPVGDSFTPVVHAKLSSASGARDLVAANREDNGELVLITCQTT